MIPARRDHSSFVIWKPARWQKRASCCISSRVKQVAEDTFEDRLEIRLAQAANRMFTRIYHHTTVLSPPRLPRKGPAILVCNHVSGLDPLLVQSACPRMIVWLMAGEYYDTKGLSWFFKM